MIREKEVPLEWKWKRLGEICEIIGGKPRPEGKEPYENGRIPFVRMRDLGKYHLTSDLRKIESLLNPEHVEKNNFRIIRKGSILIPRSGSVALNHRAVLGVDACIVSHICALELKDPSVNNLYLYYVLRQIDMRKFTKKTTGLDLITFEDLRKIRVPVPSLEIQTRIVTILEKVTQLKQWRKESDKLTEDYLYGVFFKMFGNPHTNAKKFETKGFLDIFRTSTGKLDSNASEKDGQFPFFTCSQETFRINSYSFDCEAILLSGNNAAGVFSAKYYKGKFDAYQRTYVLTLKDADNSYGYFRFLLEKKLDELRFRSIGTNTKYLTLGILKTINLMIPPAELQRRFSQVVEDVERLREYEKKSGQEIDNMYHVLMNKAFRGELDCWMQN